MENLNKGCVYFFKHVGLSPIKIGYSANESPIHRFNSFKVYAPFGAEMIGFIRTFDAKILETELHNKFSRDRLTGEWFDISIAEAEKWIKFYSDIEDVQEMSNFQVSWAKNVNYIYSNPMSVVKSVFNEELMFDKTEDFCKIVILNKKELVNRFSKENRINKSDMFLMLDDSKMRYTAHRNGDKIKRGYKFYEKCSLVP